MQPETQIRNMKHHFHLASCLMTGAHSPSWMVPPKYFGSCSLICIFPLNAAWQKVPSTGLIRKQHTMLDLDPWLRLRYSRFHLHSNFPLRHGIYGIYRHVTVQSANIMQHGRHWR